MSGEMDELEARRSKREPAKAGEAGDDQAGENELLGRLKASRRRRREVEEQLAGAGEAARASRQEAAALASRLQALAAQLEGRDAELAAARRSLAREQKRAGEERTELRLAERRGRHLRKRIERMEAEAKAGREEAQGRMLAAGELAEVIERSAHSRSWRLGHGTMKLLRRLTFRPPVDRVDPLERAAQELSRLSEPGDGRPDPEA